MKQQHFLNILARPREQLLADWDAAGFEMASKPGQMIVQGRNGRVSTDPEVTYMTDEIRQAVWDFRHATWRRFENGLLL